MINRNYYQTTLNLTIHSAVLALAGIVLSILLAFASHSITVSDAELFEPLALWLKNLLQVLAICIAFVTCIPMTIFITLVSTNIIERHKNDSVSNYLKSICQTVHMKRFLRQDESSEYIDTSDSRQSSKRYNPILVTFNRPMSKTVIDIRKDSVTVIINYPKTRQTQKILKDMNEDIKEELASMNPDYIFSSPTREGNLLVFKSTRR